MAEIEKTQGQQLLEDIEAFIIEFDLTANAVDRGAAYSAFVSRLRAGLVPSVKTIIAVRAWMNEVRAGDIESIRAAASAIKRADGFITVTPGGEIDSAPDGLDDKRLKRMIEKGILVPSGDAMFGVASQTYKVSSVPL